MKPLLSACARCHLLAIQAPITSISGQQALDNLSLASFGKYNEVKYSPT